MAALGGTPSAAGTGGPLGEDSKIGTTGARISHGRVRVHLQALERL